MRSTDCMVCGCSHLGPHFPNKKSRDARTVLSRDLRVFPAEFTRGDAW